MVNETNDAIFAQTTDIIRRETVRDPELCVVGKQYGSLILSAKGCIMH